MLGVAFIITGAVCLIAGTLSGTRYLESSSETSFSSLDFLLTVVVPLLGGAILIVFGLKEYA